MGEQVLSDTQKTPGGGEWLGEKGREEKGRGG
jgi:hypothetical protein